MKKLQKLPIGDSSFESIRQDNRLYVDKTRHIFQMADEDKYYFMSRPRRFGKSLTVSTLRCLFQGRKELFEGLWIKDNTAWEWKEHPVIVIDFNEIPHQTPETLTRSIWLSMDQTAHKYGISLNTDFIETRFRELVVALENRYKTQVVVLVDEYDKPIIDHIGKGKESVEIAFRNRDVLKGANVSPCLKFVFITGVSKFSRVSIFSELNNLKDLTMNEDYADMLGYTQEDMATCFEPYITRFDQVLMTLEYSREYRTYFHISTDYGMSEANCYKLIKKTEDILIRSDDFRLPDRKELAESDTEIRGILADATETPTERPEKNRNFIPQVKRSGIRLRPDCL